MRFGARLAVLALLTAPVAGVVYLLPGLAFGQAPSSSASFTASDFQWKVTGTNSSTVTIAPGGVVTFGYPTGASEHNADFGSGSPQPTSCTQTAGPSSGAVPPLPNQPTAPGWSGTCTFDTPGTYTFHCDLHPFMTGTVVVSASGTSTTTATSTSTASTTQTTTTTRSGSTSQPAAAPALGLALARREVGTHVTGSVRVAHAGSRLQVTLFAPAHRSIGHLTRRVTRAGRIRFSVSISAAARRTLRRAHHLTVTVAVTVTSPSGAHAKQTGRLMLAH